MILVDVEFLLRSGVFSALYVSLRVIIASTRWIRLRFGEVGVAGSSLGTLVSGMKTCVPSAPGRIFILKHKMPS